MSMACVADFRDRAQRRLPKFVFDYLDGGAGSESGVRRNQQALDALMLKPRALVNVEQLDLSTTVFGRTFSLPFGTAPVGMGNVIWPGAEEAIVRAAVGANIPFTLSTAANTSLEQVAKIAPQHCWFQLYVAKREDHLLDLVGRAEHAGYEVLMVTVDVPLPARRLRDIRNHFTIPFRITPAVARELVRHPLWSLETLRAGMPRFVNFEKYAPGMSRASLAAYIASQMSSGFDWDGLKKLRDRWPRHLLIKGLLSAEDAARAKACGCDGW